MNGFLSGERGVWFIAMICPFLPSYSLLIFQDTESVFYKKILFFPSFLLNKWNGLERYFHAIFYLHPICT